MKDSTPHKLFADDHDLLNDENGLCYCRRCHGGEIELEESCADKLARQLAEARKENEALRTLWTEMRVVLVQSRNANCLASYGSAQVDAVEACNKILNVMPADIGGLLDALRAQLAEAKKDGERLDWLDQQSTYSSGRAIHAPESPDPMPFVFSYGLHSRAKKIHYRGGVRTAIDAAMAGKSEIDDPFPPLPEYMRDMPLADVCEHGTPKGYYCAKCAARNRPTP
jgi:hypothetical protein